MLFVLFFLSANLLNEDLAGGSLLELLFWDAALLLAEDLTGAFAGCFVAFC